MLTGSVDNLGNTNCPHAANLILHVANAEHYLQTVGAKSNVSFEFVQTREEEAVGREVHVTLQEILTTDKVISPCFVLMCQYCRLEGRLHATRSHLTHLRFIASCKPTVYPKMTLKNCLEIADDACTVPVPEHRNEDVFSLSNASRC